MPSGHSRASQLGIPRADLRRLEQLALDGDQRALKAAWVYERMKRHRRGTPAHQICREAARRAAMEALGVVASEAG